MKTASKSASNRRLALLALLALATPLRADSLWANASSERSMFADRKAGARGDILTIVVSESASASNTQRKKSDQSSDLDAAVSSFLFPSSGFGKHKGELPAAGFSQSRSFDGGGQQSASQNLTARAAVLVADVLPNGNLVIEGVRLVKVSGESQYVVLHGIVRPDDITSANTILSSNIADARIEVISEGSLNDAQKKGWLTRLYDTLKPF